jgi:hypothetical protein
MNIIISCEESFLICKTVSKGSLRIAIKYTRISSGVGREEEIIIEKRRK